MIAIPAVDPREGRRARPIGGNKADASSLPVDASGLAKSLSDLGFSRLHLVALDGRPSNGNRAPVLEDIVRETDATLQVAGASSGSAIEQLFRSGADYVVVGARALEEPEWLAEIADLYPDAILVGTDVRDRRLVRRGWVRTLPVDILDVVEDLNSVPLGGLLIGGLQLEGPARAADLSLVEDVVELSRAPVLVAATVGTLDDLRALEHRGVSGAVFGTDQLVNGSLDARAIAREFGT